MSMSSHDEWPYRDKASAWTPPPKKLHWKEVAAGEPHRSLHPTSCHLGPEQPDWGEKMKAASWGGATRSDSKIEQTHGSLSAQVRTARQAMCPPLGTN